MRRWLLSASVVALAAPAFGQAKPEAKLPIKQVVLFSSGVGYFGREAEIDGDAKVELQFPARDINDLLKSMTLRDLGTGSIDAVSYDSQDPVERTLRSFAVDLTGNPSQAALLQQARGEKVDLWLNNGNAAVGSIVGVEKQKRLTDKGPVEEEFLTLWGDGGLTTTPLRDVQRVSFTNPALRDEVGRALAVLATSRDSRKKAVTVQFRGQGKRPVRVGYVVESPVWKTSYRLVVPTEGKPFLQGWALVENPSDEDWNDVRMTLVSGRPISFQMDLYQPLYVPRPKVEIERYASLRPQVYDGSMAGRMPAVVAATPSPAPMPKAPAPDGRPGDARQRSRFTGGLTEKSLNDAESPLEAKRDEPLNLAQGVESAASAAQLGDTFQYAIKLPVNLPRQKSALLPIVQQEVAGERVSIFNPATHAKFPLLGLRFTNATGASLMQGPVTVFDATTYAGDARLPDLQPDEKRLISYAIDLGTEVEAQTKYPPHTITSIKVVKGVVHAATKVREERTYRAVNRSALDRTLLIEHPYRAEYTLVSDLKPEERTRDLYRFAVKLPARGNGEAAVAEEQTITEYISIGNGDSDRLRVILRQRALSAKAKAAIEEALTWQSRLAAKGRESADVARQLAAIERDQQRLRENLKVTPEGTSARKRYLDKFDAQEPQIEKLQADQRKLAEEQSKLLAEYTTFLENLSVD